ncbi:MAG: SAM-dependent DNA methyltransferase [Desulfobulbaceae bacterium]|uniref:site-specific DNA-methyltransferase (adenine-specific) n=1 Tax=Candidatus Desulfatifera sulfidica TaxID=2841691 RepID=A0A8J6TCX8_9BACT|nr:SAM-dependent DNA methyltransferase [Candidatus Desulfatifera sulfidica]
MNFSSTAAFIWSVADLLRGDFKQSEYGKIILPFTLLRRLECVLEPTKEAVLTEYEARKSLDIPLEQFLIRKSGQSFYNISKMDLSRLGETGTLDNLESYVADFSRNARDIFENFRFNGIIGRLADANLLYLIVKRFANVDLHPETISNHEMGLIFEELIRRFAEASNETAGEHFTPRDIVRLTTSLVFMPDDDVLTKPGVVRSLYDPTAGTGGFLSSGSEYVYELNDQARIVNFGQELNPESYAICKADMLIKGQDVTNIKLGNTLSDDQLYSEQFDYCLSNPPFGVEWKKVEKAVKDEHSIKGFNGRFGPGLPRVSDGSLLFLLHLISKMRNSGNAGSRIGIILNGSPLFTGGAGSGESEIRRYILEHDLLEGIVAMPTDMFYNTGIATYVWILSNRKDAERKGKVQLINATSMGSSMRKSLGSKRKYLTEEDIVEITKSYGRYDESEICKIFNTTAFGYRRITVEHPLQLAFHPKEQERTQALQADKPFAKWPAPLQTATLDALAMFDKEKILDRKVFKKQLISYLGGKKLTAAQFKLVQKHIGEHDEEAEICLDNKGNPEPASDLRDYENVPLSEAVEAYFKREVLPHVPDAWIDASKRDKLDGDVGIVGYEIPFNRHFYKYVPPRSLEEIDADLDKVSGEIMELLREVHS